MLEERPSGNKPAKPQLSQDLTDAACDPTWDGLPLEDYAREAQLDEAEVWKRLRRGDLIGRTQRGRLFVYSHEGALPPEDAAASAAPTSRTFGAWVSDQTTEPTAPATTSPDADRGALSSLPPLPGPADERPGASSGGFLALSGERAHSPEMALLLDHLSLAKEENREILRLTQHSIQKVTELTDKIVEMKDTVIEAKDAQILALMQQLESKDQRIKKLSQQNEDLEMLARTMAEDQR